MEKTFKMELLNYNLEKRSVFGLISEQIVLYESTKRVKELKRAIIKLLTQVKYRKHLPVIPNIILLLLWRLDVNIKDSFPTVFRWEYFAVWNKLSPELS